MATVTTKANEAPLVHPRIGCWIETTTKCLPPVFFVAGKDKNGSVAVIRTRYNNKFVIGKYVEGWGPFVPDGEAEVHLDDDHIFEVFCHSQLRWERWDGKVPAYAFVAGHNEDGRELYIGRTTADGHTVVGGIRDNALYYTWKQSVHKSNTFEVLVLDFCTHFKQCLA